MPYLYLSAIWGDDSRRDL